ncbi:hypothetical protein COO60DRAFT_1152867 [Scenedesmus sp. NREL 46B-D3]|nr:hypothetical protein COO60DRAFT_1152867 [Scenedesmus sp. NREL 46B-D3]
MRPRLMHVNTCTSMSVGPDCVPRTCHVKEWYIDELAVEMTTQTPDGQGACSCISCSAWRQGCCARGRSRASWLIVHSFPSLAFVARKGVPGARQLLTCHWAGHMAASFICCGLTGVAADGVAPALLLTQMDSALPSSIRAVSCCTGSAMTACSSKTQLAGFCLAGLHWEWLPLMPVCRLLHRLRQARTTSTAASVNIDRPDAFCGR